jgi:hypothetical protein
MKKPTEDHNWYVYQYVDPRAEHTGQVIYIGKGTHYGDNQHLRRMHTHWQLAEHKNQLFRRVLNKIDAEGLMPIISVVSWHDSERSAFDAEIENIAKYGLRRDGGTLCNLTLGGEGAEGMIHPDEVKAKIADASNRHWANSEYREKRAESQRRYIDEHQDDIAARAVKTSQSWTADKRSAQAEGVRSRGPEYGAKIAEIMTDPARRKKASETARTALQRPEVIARRKATLKGTMADPAFRAELSARTKAALATPEAKANQQAAAQKMWADPEYRAKMAEIRSKPVSDETRKRQSDAMKKSIANMDPETKARLSALRSQMTKERHARNRAAKELAAKTNPP